VNYTLFANAFSSRIKHFRESNSFVLNIFRKCFTLYIIINVKIFVHNFIVTFLSREGEGLAQ